MQESLFIFKVFPNDPYGNSQRRLPFVACCRVHHRGDTGMPHECEGIHSVLFSLLDRMKYAAIWHRNVAVQEIKYERNRH